MAAGSVAFAGSCQPPAADLPPSERPPPFGAESWQEGAPSAGDEPGAERPGGAPLVDERPGEGGALQAGSGGSVDPSESALPEPDEPDSMAPDLPLGDGFYVMENLDRGLVAVVQGGGVFVSWRMFGYEYDPASPERIAYEVYRGEERIASVTDSTNLLDPEGTASSRYSVAAVIDGVEGPRSASVAPWAEQFLRIELESPGGNYRAHDASVGDVDGDGQYEIFMIWQPDNAQDNSNGGVTDDVFLDALRLDGTRLWRIDLGPNIRAGEHYTQFVVIDADGDGRAELAMKTAPGTVAGDGRFLALGPAEADDDAAVFRNGNGYVLSGPEYFTVFEGATGRELATAPYHQARGDVGSWGDGYGNRVDRFLAAAAYLDDTGLPSFVMARGYYTRTTLAAWNWRGGELTPLWRFDSNDTPADAQNRPFTGQGAHSLSVANVDGDLGQEIVYGAMTIDHDGRGMCSTGMDHGDALHVADLILDRPGVEVFMPTETTSRPHWTIRDGATCEILQQSDQTGADVGRAVAADVVASNPGGEFWASSGVALRSASTGQPIGGPQPSSVNFLIWWDDDELRELEDGTSIDKVGVGRLLSCGPCASNNGTKSVPSLVADIIGDWREEVIWREADNSALRLYTTVDRTQRRLFTLMHDPQYRAAISWQNVAYNQPPHPSFHIGAEMADPPRPNIVVLPVAE